MLGASYTLPFEKCISSRAWTAVVNIERELNLLHGSLYSARLAEECSFTAGKFQHSTQQSNFHHQRSMLRIYKSQVEEIIQLR